MNFTTGDALTFAIYTSLISSVIFLVCLFILKSLVTVSSTISKQIDVNTKKPRFFVKIMNRSPLKLFEIQLEAKLIRNSYGITSGGGLNKQAVDVALSTNRISYISSFKFWKKLTLKKKDWPARNCRLIEILSPLDDLINDNTTLEFALIARHSISGFPKVKVQDYIANDIKEGKFLHGLTSKVDKDDVDTDIPPRVNPNIIEVNCPNVS